MHESKDLTDRSMVRKTVASLRSELCPGCGGVKRPKTTLCSACYRDLPQPKRNALYKMYGDGYIEAVEDALLFLGVSAPHWPEVK